MSNINFDFLADSFLLNENCIANRYNDYTDDDLQKELEKYRAHCLNNLKELTSSVQNIDSNLKVIARDDYFDANRILQSALYLDNYVVYDPIIPFTTPVDTLQKTASEFFTESTTYSLREPLLSSISVIKSLQPLVAGGFVRMLPLSVYFEPPEKVPIYISGEVDKYGRSIIDEETRRYFVKNFVLKTFINKDGCSEPSEKLTRTRHVNCQFGDYDGYSMDYYYFDSAPNLQDESANSFSLMIEKDALPPSKEEFRKWISWCFSSSALFAYKQVKKHISIAKHLGTQPIVSTEFESGLLRINSSEKSIQSTTAENLINMELPFVSRIDADKLMKWRQDEVVFNNFRSKMEEYLRQARYITDPVELKRFHDDFIHEVTNVQLPQLNNKLRSLSAKFGRNLAISTTVGLMAAMQGAQFETATAIGTGVQGLSSLWDYRADRRENPFFFLHKILS